MGKSRRNRSGAARRDPIAKEVKPPSDPELAALREAKILPVIQDLKSSDPKSRSAAASAVSNIIQDTRCRKLLLREQIVHTVMTQTITDDSIESRAAGWGILRVLAQEEEADFCVHLYRSDITTAIEFAAKFITEKLQQKAMLFSNNAKAERGVWWSIASSLVSLLTALAEAGDDILVAISSNTTITRMLALIVSYKSPIENEEGVDALKTDALACFMILCEDNEKLAESIAKASDDPFVTSIMSLKDEVNSDGILACAVLHNIFASLAGSRKGAESNDGDDAVLIPTLTKAISSFNPENVISEGSGWSNPVEYQQLALETIAAIGTSLTTTMTGGASAKPARPAQNGSGPAGAEDDENMDDANDDEELAEDGEDDAEEDEDEDDEMDQEAMEADMDMVTGGDDDDDISDLPVLQALIDTTLPELIRIASSQPSNDEAIAIQGHALSALNNIAWSLSLVDFSDDHNTGIQKAWSPAAHSIWERVVSPILASDTADLTLATQVTSIAWALARALQSKTPLKTGEQQKFISLYQATKGSANHPAEDEDPFQSLGVKCIGVLGQLALDPCSEDLNREIGTFLITLVVALPNTPAADAVEAFNQLFDIYGNEEASYDKSVFWGNNFIGHLESSVAKARSMAKSVDKRTQSELRLRADEVVMNLTRFLAYKKKNKPTN